MISADYSCIISLSLLLLYRVPGKNIFCSQSVLNLKNLFHSPIFRFSSKVMTTTALLHGKSVLVTGSTSGIGWSIATQFVKAGAQVMLQGLEKESEVGHLISQLEGLAPSARVAYTQADLSSEKSCNHLIAHTADTLRSLDILVNNAGIQFTSRTESYPTEKWDAVLKLNLYAPFFLSRAALPEMYKKGWGRLVHIGSAHSLRASPNKSAYCAAKHGVLGMDSLINHSYPFVN